MTFQKNPQKGNYPKKSKENKKNYLEKPRETSLKKNSIKKCMITRKPKIFLKKVIKDLLTDTVELENKLLVIYRRREVMEKEMWGL